MGSAANRLAACAALALVAVGASSHRDPRQLRPGLFLYASPAQQDPNFAESVVLLVEHSASGSMGLVVNRPTGRKPSLTLARLPAWKSFGKNERILLLTLQTTHHK